LGAGDEALGFKLTMAIFAVISVALFWITFATTRERVQPVQEDTQLRRDFRALLRNGPWIALFACAIFTLMNVAVRNGTIMYYFKYYVGDDGTPLFLIFDKTAVFMSLGLLAMVVGTTLTKTLCDYFEKRHLLIALMTVNAISMGLFYVTPPDQYWLMVAINCVGMLFNGPAPALVWAMYTDTADYGEWKSGRRTTGLIFSSLLFAQKLGLAVGAGLAGVILGWFGFVANEAQSAESLAGIRFLFSIVPAMLAIAGAAAIFFYRIDSKTIKTFERELQERHAGATG
jgi:GPH family glycoside/pentoside/hexuronide:cation symporter